MNKDLIKTNESYNSLVNDIGSILSEARGKMSREVNSIMVDTYWHIGKYIVEYEQQGKERAEYGSNLLNRLSKDLTRLYGKGFGRSNLLYIRKLYICFPKSGTVSHLLGWSHYYEILKSDNELERSFYIKECERQRWSVRELKRQMSSMLFHRIALSKDKEGVLRLVEQGNEVQSPKDIIRDPFVLEFVGLPDINHYDESSLEQSLVSNLGQFMLELGRGFAFIGQQYRFSIAGRHYYVDLVFYHVVLKTYVLIDLKRDEVQHEDVGQMNFYLNYFRNEVCTAGDNEPIGIVLGATADKMTMEYAMGGISNQLFVSRYQLYLPDREMLENELWRMMRKQELLQQQRLEDEL
ncbi:PDDEXK nuclease domain-containing protein [Xylanibacter caecicola]|uniref:PDDEXK nuclease domain-containing protein n=1 Tax=Xylanibacter caecicola TaxID=2736294 RepID=UPI00259037F9|nr:PDDEXK nuclease domain-containing protein [Xylanibacter caecicola]